MREQAWGFSFYKLVLCRHSFPEQAGSIEHMPVKMVGNVLKQNPHFVFLYADVVNNLVNQARIPCLTISSM